VRADGVHASHQIDTDDVRIGVELLQLVSRGIGNELGEVVEAGRRVFGLERPLGL